MDGQKKATRRRGEVLEEAILHAAWEELSQIGYTHLTMESVASRAVTNKAVLYRRWANKSDLVIAALRKNLPKISNEVPNTGNLRDDVYAYLHGITKPIQSIGAQTIRGLMMEPLVWNTLIAPILSSMPQIVHPESGNKITAAMRVMLKNAEKRGEVRLEKLTPRIISLPWDLLRSELITRQELTNTAIAEIVDDIFLPLVYGHSSNRI